MVLISSKAVFLFSIKCTHILEVEMEEHRFQLKVFNTHIIFLLVFLSWFLSSRLQIMVVATIEKVLCA